MPAPKIRLEKNVKTRRSFSVALTVTLSTWCKQTMRARACAVCARVRPKLWPHILRLQKPLSSSWINCPRYMYGSSLSYQNFPNLLCTTLDSTSSSFLMRAMLSATISRVCIRFNLQCRDDLDGTSLSHATSLWQFYDTNLFGVNNTCNALTIVT